MSLLRKKSSAEKASMRLNASTGHNTTAATDKTVLSGYSSQQIGIRESFSNTKVNVSSSFAYGGSGAVGNQSFSKGISPKRGNTGSSQRFYKTPNRAGGQGIGQPSSALSGGFTSPLSKGAGNSTTNLASRKARLMSAQHKKNQNAVRPRSGFSKPVGVFSQARAMNNASAGRANLLIFNNSQQTSGLNSNKMLRASETGLPGINRSGGGYRPQSSMQAIMSGTQVSRRKQASRSPMTGTNRNMRPATASASHQKRKTMKHVNHNSFANQIGGHDDSPTNINVKTPGVSSPFNIQAVMEQNKRELEENLSVFTKRINAHIDEQMKEMNKIEKFKNEQGDSYHDVGHVDAKVLLHNVAREYKTMHYRLSKIICSEDKHIQLYNRKPQEIEVIESQYMYFKINTTGMLSPGKMIIQYGEGQYVSEGNRRRRNVDLKVYLSSHHKEPNDQNHQKVVSNPQRIVQIKGQGKDKFETDWMYFSLYSLTGCSVELTVQFLDEVVSKQSKQKARAEAIGDQDYGETLVIKKYNQFKKKEERDTDNFINRNCQEVGNYYYNQMVRQDKLRQIKEEKMRIFQARRDLLNMERHKFKTFLIHKWDIIKERKQEFKEEVIQRQKGQRHKRDWATLMSTCAQLAIIAKKFERRRSQIYKERREQQIAEKIQQLFVQFLQNSSPIALQQRYKQQVSRVHHDAYQLQKMARSHVWTKSALTATSTMLIDPMQESAKALMMEFLQKTSANYSILTALRKFCHNVRAIQIVVRSGFNSKKGRQEASILIIDEELDKLIESEKAKSKKKPGKKTTSEISKKLKNIGKNYVPVLATFLTQFSYERSKLRIYQKKMLFLQAKVDKQATADGETDYDILQQNKHNELEYNEILLKIQAQEKSTNMFLEFFPSDPAFRQQLMQKCNLEYIAQLLLSSKATYNEHVLSVFSRSMLQSIIKRFATQKGACKKVQEFLSLYRIEQRNLLKELHERQRMQ